MHGQNLINIDFGGLEGAKLGYAAAGQSPADYWNPYSAPWVFVSSITNLKFADGTVSDVGLTVSGARGQFGSPVSDPMYSSFIFNLDGTPNYTVELTNVPVGLYDVYIYGHGNVDVLNGTFTLIAGNINYGTNATLRGPGWESPIWQEGVQYVVFRGVQVTDAAPDVTLVALTGTNGLGHLNGMQIAPSGPHPPLILIQPESQAIWAGLNATFTVGVIGTAPLQYQWFVDGRPIFNATNFSLVITNASQSNIALYSVRITNAFDSVTSSNAALSVNESPSITKQPEPESIILGATASFSVEAAGTAPLQYQWLFNGSILDGATNISLEIPGVQSTNAGVYSVIVTNTFGSTNSADAQLSIRFPPSFVTQPQSQTLVVGATATFTVGVSGDEPFSYQWFFNGDPINDATNSSLVLPDLKFTNAGNYSVAVTNDVSSVSSSEAALVVNNPPPGPLININFAGVEGAKVGFAATGQTAGDYWNAYPIALASIPNLKFSNGELSGVSVFQMNSAGEASNGAADPMYNTYLFAYPEWVADITVTITKLPPGFWDVYVYGHLQYDNYPGIYTLTVDGINYGTKSTVVGKGWDSRSWQEGVQYVLFRDVRITSAIHDFTVSVSPSNYGWRCLSGLQIAPSGSLANPTIIVRVPTAGGGNLGNIELTWPLSASNFVLQSTVDLSANLWTNLSPELTIQGPTSISVTLPTSSAQNFYRLKGP